MSESESDGDFYTEADFDQTGPVESHIYKHSIPFHVQRLKRKNSVGEHVEKTEHEFQFKTKKVFKVLEFGMVQQSPYELLHNVASRFVTKAPYMKHTKHINVNALILGIDASIDRFVDHNNNSVISLIKGSNPQRYLYRRVTEFEMHEEFLLGLIKEKSPLVAAKLLFRYFSSSKPAKCHKFIALAFYAFFCRVECTLEAIESKCQLISYCLYSIGNCNAPVIIPFFQEYIFQTYETTFFNVYKEQIGSKKSWGISNRTLYLDGDLKLYEEMAFNAHIEGYECFNDLDLKLLQRYYLCSNFDSFEYFVKVLSFINAPDENLSIRLCEVLFYLSKHISIQLEFSLLQNTKNFYPSNFNI